MSTKRSLYEGLVVLKSLYGAETWNMGAAERNVEALRYLRSMCGVTLMNRVKNEMLFGRTGLSSNTSIAMVWVHRENGRRVFGEEDNRI